MRGVYDGVGGIILRAIGVVVVGEVADDGAWVELVNTMTSHSASGRYRRPTRMRSRRSISLLDPELVFVERNAKVVGYWRSAGSHYNVCVCRVFLRL